MVRTRQRRQPIMRTGRSAASGARGTLDEGVGADVPSTQLRSPRWRRRWPTAVVLAVCAIVLAAVQGLLGLLEAAVWVKALALVLVAGTAVGVQLENMRASAAKVREADLLARAAADQAEERWVRRASAALMSWPCQPLAEIDPSELGVKRSALANLPDDTIGDLPRYIPRDQDRVAEERLRERGLLLLVGAPGSGVSRTALEVARSDPTTRVAVVPQPPKGLKEADDLDALSRLGPPRRLLVWVDRIDEHAPNGITAKLLRRWRERSPGLRVIATIPTNRYETWQAERHELAQEFGDPVWLDRLATADEISRALEVYPGVDFSEGIAAAFTALQSLKTRWVAGYSDCPHDPPGSDCVVARAVVPVAVDWVNTGTLRPLRETVLQSLVDERLGRAIRVDRAHLSSALDWALSRTPVGAALLTRDVQQGESLIRPNAEVAEVWASEEVVPVAAWVASTKDAAYAEDSDSIGRIGFTAHTLGMQVEAERAWTLIKVVDEPAATWLRRAATYSHTRHDTRAEVTPKQHLVRVNENSYGPSHRYVATTLHNLGNAWAALQEPAKARALHERALAINEREFGPEDPAVAESLDKLGQVWEMLEEPGTARDLHERALAINERAFGSADPRVAATMVDLGRAWESLGEPGTARDLLERALEIQEQEFGSDHARVAATLVSLGNAWNELGEPGKARDLYERALAVKEKEFGSTHPAVAPTLVNLGNTWNELGRPDKARDLHERALAIKERAFGPDNPSVAISLVNLGNAWDALGEPGKARDLCERALAIQEAHFGSEHGTVATTLVNLGRAWAALGEAGRARDLHERALAINEREFGADHPAVAATLVNLGDSLSRMGRPEQARDRYVRALRIMLARFPDGHPLISAATTNLRCVAPDLIVLDDGRILDESASASDTSSGAPPAAAP